MQYFATNTVIVANNCILFSRKMLNIKEYRISKGYTQQELSDLAGLKKRTYINYENGDSDIPVSKLQKIAEVLDVSIQLLLSTSKNEGVNDPVQDYQSNCQRCKEKDELISALRKTVASQEELIQFLKK
jgi:transcriptional regulator with XRE-family HTH domain